MISHEHKPELQRFILQPIRSKPDTTPTHSLTIWCRICKNTRTEGWNQQFRCEEERGADLLKTVTSNVWTWGLCSRHSMWARDLTTPEWQIRWTSLSALSLVIATATEFTCDVQLLGRSCSEVKQIWWKLFLWVAAKGAYVRSLSHLNHVHVPSAVSRVWGRNETQSL